jgi:SnoaL-like polyketide cyclase
MAPDLARLRKFGARYTSAWCSQDPAAVAEFYSHEGSLTINDGPPSVGRNAIAEAARSFVSAFPDMTVVMDGLVLRGEEAEYRWTLTGTNSGPGGTGHRVCISGFEKWRLDDTGLIASSRGHFDAAEYGRQLREGA